MDETAKTRRFSAQGSWFTLTVFLLASWLSAAPTPVKELRLTTDADAGGFSITNLPADFIHQISGLHKTQLVENVDISAALLSWASTGMVSRSIWVTGVQSNKIESAIDHNWFQSWVNTNDFSGAGGVVEETDPVFSAWLNTNVTIVVESDPIFSSWLETNDLASVSIEHWAPTGRVMYADWLVGVQSNVLANAVQRDELHTVAYSGDYLELDNKPDTIDYAYVLIGIQSNVLASALQADAIDGFIKIEDVQDYALPLSGIATQSWYVVGVQSNKIESAVQVELDPVFSSWLLTGSVERATWVIGSQSNLIAGAAQASELHAVAWTGDYGDLTGVPAGDTFDDVLARGATTTRSVTIGTRAVGKTVGGNSLVVGTSGEASYKGSISLGDGTVASSLNSVAMGLNTKATGAYSVAQGQNTTASQSNSHAQGISTTASGNSSHAEGNTTTASGNFSHAEGYTTTASGQYSHAEGHTSQAIGTASHAEGHQTKAAGSYSWTAGHLSETKPGANYSAAFGYKGFSTNLYAYIWQGYTGTGARSEYYTHGNGTYNINPVGGTAGFYIGNSNLDTHMSQSIFDATNDLIQTYILNTNSYMTISNGLLSIWQKVDSTVTQVWESVEVLSVELDPAVTNSFFQAIRNVQENVDKKADKAWGKYASDGSANPDHEQTTFINSPSVMFAGGVKWDTAGEFGVVVADGNIAFLSEDGGEMRIGSDSYTNYFGFRTGRSFLVGAVASSINVAMQDQGGGTTNYIITIDYLYEDGDFPVIWFTPTLSKDIQWQVIDTPIWVDNQDGTATVTVSVTSPKGFFKGTSSASIESEFFSKMPASFDGGIIGSTNSTPVIYDSTITISSGGRSYRIPAQEIK